MTEALPGILAIFNNAAPGREAEFEEWFQHEHLAERIAVPGFLLGRRYEAVSGQPRYFNFYLTQSADVLKSAAYLERLDHPTPMTHKIMSEIFKDMIRTVCHRTLRLGAMRGAAAVAVRFTEKVDQDALKATLERLVQDKAVACGEIWSAVDASDHFRCPRRSGCAAATARSRLAFTSRRCGWRKRRRSQATLSEQFPAARRSASIACSARSGLSVRLPPSPP